MRMKSSVAWRNLRALALAGSLVPGAARALRATASSLLRPASDCRRSIRSVITSLMAAWSATGPIRLISSAAPLPTSIASSRARSLVTCRYRRPPSMTWSSISRPLGRSASTCRTRCSPAPTTLLGGAATWPLAARAQQGERMRRIGILQGLAENDPEWQRRLAAFKQGLQELGWTEGRNVAFEFRFADNKPERLPGLAAELVQANVDVIGANDGPPVDAG